MPSPTTRCTTDCCPTGGAWAYTHDQSRVLPVHEAAATYRESPRSIIAGANYGAGSSRVWTAKAPALLGVRGVIAESFERIHRSNMIGMSIFPLQFSARDESDELPAHGVVAGENHGHRPWSQQRIF